TRPTRVDWVKAERFYRAGIIRVEAIAQKLGCTRQAVYKKAKEKGWTRSLSPRVHSVVTCKLDNEPDCQLPTSATVNEPGKPGEHTDARHNVPAPVDASDVHAREDEALVEAARDFRGLVGLDLARDVTCAQSYRWDEMLWAWPGGHAKRETPGHRVVAIDYGAKRNILRSLASAGCDVTVLPATATADDVLALNPQGVFLSNGPGDPAATGEYAVPMIRDVLDRADIPMFGICLGHQMLARALGAQTVKMNHGHHGANHPVKDVETGKVEITSMNHGFTVDSQSLPDGVVETHVSLFDGSNCGIRMSDRPVWSVQYHPEASPGPQDSYYLFERFARAMDGTA
ncbi:hypothetical protein LCGC14_2798880, partial [marine sediment metagenome]